MPPRDSRLLAHDKPLTKACHFRLRLTVREGLLFDLSVNWRSNRLSYAAPRWGFCMSAHLGI